MKLLGCSSLLMLVLISPSVQEDFNLPQFEPEQNLSIAIDPTHPIDNTTTRYLQLNLSTIDDDIAVEGTESIIVELSSFSDKVRQGEYFTTTIHIANNDGEYNKCR